VNTELEAGSPAPDFELTSNAGQKIGLVDYMGKSHVAPFFVRKYD